MAAWHTLTLHGTAPTTDSTARVSLRYILGRGDDVSDEEFKQSLVGRLMAGLKETDRFSLQRTRVDRDLDTGKVHTYTGNILREFSV